MFPPALCRGKDGVRSGREKTPLRLLPRSTVRLLGDAWIRFAGRLQVWLWPRGRNEHPGVYRMGRGGLGTIRSHSDVRIGGRETQDPGFLSLLSSWKQSESWRVTKIFDLSPRDTEIAGMLLCGERETPLVFKAFLFQSLVFLFKSGERQAINKFQAVFDRNSER